MPIIKNLYGADPASFVLEALARTHAIPVRREHVDLTIQNVNGTQANLVITARETATNLQTGVYVGARVIPYAKVDITPFVGRDICYGGDYPITFQRLQDYFASSYGLSVQPGQWRMVYGSINLLLDEDAVVDFDLSSSRIMRMEATVNHPLIQQGKGFALQITVSALSVNPMRLALNMPASAVIGEPLDLSFDVNGGVGPYTLTVVDGTPPVPMKVDNVGMAGQLLNEGQFDLTVLAQDRDGRQTSTSETTTVVLKEFRFDGVAATGFVGQFYRYQYSLRGGLAPYQKVSTEGLPVGASLDNNGVLLGFIDAGSYDLRFRYKDTLGTIKSHVDSLTIEGRTREGFGQDLWVAIDDWVDLDSTVHDENEYLPSHQGDALWYLDGDRWTHTLGPHGAALTFAGDIVRQETSAFLRTSMGVTLFIDGARANTGSCLVSYRDANTGWDLSVGDVQQGQLRLRAFINNQPYILATTPETLIIDDDPVMITAQCVGGLMTIHRNEVLIASMFVPDAPIDLSGNESLIVGGREDTTGSYRWHGKMRKVILYTARIWGDQIAYLYNGGQGREFDQVKAELNGSGVWSGLTITAPVPPFAVGEARTVEIELNGGSVYISEPEIVGDSTPDSYSFTIVGSKCTMSARWDSVGSHSTKLLVSTNRGSKVIDLVFNVA